MTTTTDGRIVERRTYWPFGGERGDETYDPDPIQIGSPRTDLLFTGQRKEANDAAGLGLYNYKARFYSTVLGRFASVDPMVGAAGDPQSWNAYTYVRNNPLGRIDPTARCRTRRRKSFGAASQSGRIWS